MGEFAEFNPDHFASYDFSSMFARALGGQRARRIANRHGVEIVGVAGHR